jgi:DNA-binding MarR family transcriptional regulator
MPWTEEDLNAENDGDDFGRLVALVSTGRASSRSELARLSGLSRSTVSQRLDTLLRKQLLVETGDGPSTGGRRPVLLGLNPAAGLVLAADIGVSHCRLAVADLGGQVQAQLADALDIAAGPRAVLSWVIAGFERLLGEVGRDPKDVRARSTSPAALLCARRSCRVGTVSWYRKCSRNASECQPWSTTT